MRLLVIGRTGQVARELAASAPGRGHAVTALGREAVDLADPAAAARAVEAAEADAVINAAAYTAVDKAEEDETLARTVNAEAPGAMAAAAAARGLPFLHISTDYVFDGRPGPAWREDDPVGPQSAYGRTKRAGEEAVAAVGGPHAILRTAWVFSPHGANFVKTMLRVGAERDRLTVVHDQRGGPTPAAAVAEALLIMAEAFGAGRGTSGIFHFAGAPAVSWAEFAEAIFAHPGTPATGTAVDRITTAEFPRPAARPANSILDCDRIDAAYGIAQPDWRPALATLLEELT